MLIKLTEVCSNGALTTNQRYTLREVLVNPEHVIMIREESSIRQLHEEGLLHAGLDRNHRFSKLTINRGHNGTDIVVIGAPELVEQQLKSTKQLLRG
jgi:hypothetical protein|tara:strand:- start:692 stop:982 length:291 start_codon:yes stop_codon:yes gene_type:complete